MKGLLYGIKRDVTTDNLGNTSFWVEYIYKELEENISFDLIIDKFKQASDIALIKVLYLFDTNNNQYSKLNNCLNPVSLITSQIKGEINYLLEENFRITLESNDTGKYFITKLKDNGILLESEIAHSTNNATKIIIELDGNQIDWEHSTETNDYQQYGEEVWEDDDNMEPDYLQFEELKNQILKLFPEYSCKVEYSEKQSLTLTIYL